MTTILVPTDFSPVSRNAALYAFGLAKQLNAQRVIFYNAYQSAPTVINETGMPSMPMQVTDIELLRDINSDNMKQFRLSVESNCPQGVVLSDITEFGLIDRDINEICASTDAQLIVMGTNETSKIEEVFLGSTATSVARHTKVPVIVVPENVINAQIKNVVLVSDFKNIAETLPVGSLKTLLTAAGAQLSILHIDEDGKETSENAAGQQLFQSLLSEFNPRFHFITNSNFIAAINNFADANNTDLIVTIPKKHAFLEGLFKERHTKKLAFHSHVPVMYIHDENL